MRHQKKRYSVPRSQYAKIPLKTKLKFLKKIINEGFSIKDVWIYWISRLRSTILTIPQPRLLWGNIGLISFNLAWISLLRIKFLPGTAKRKEFDAVTVVFRLNAKLSPNSSFNATILEIVIWMRTTAHYPLFVQTAQKSKYRRNKPKWPM